MKKARFWIKEVKDGFVRGYVKTGAESGSPELFERKEAFSYGHDHWETYPPNNSLEGDNVWPSLNENSYNNFSPENFRKQANLFYHDNVVASKAISCLIGLSLGVDEKIMLEKIVNNSAERISLMRLFHYLTQENYQKKSISNVIGSSPHTDWGYLTLIFSTQVGLEASIPNESDSSQSEWATISTRPKEENAILINCGDWLSYHSKGLYKSPLHRVRAATDENRLSTVFFFYPEYNADGTIISRNIGEELLGKNSTDYKNLGMLKDQVMFQSDDISAEGTIMSMEEKMLTLPFGSFISKKWESVQRKGTAY